MFVPGYLQLGELSRRRAVEWKIFSAWSSVLAHTKFANFKLSTMATKQTKRSKTFKQSKKPQQQETKVAKYKSSYIPQDVLATLSKVSSARLMSVKRSVSPDSDFGDSKSIGMETKDEKDNQLVLDLSLRILRGIFKADHPYRTRLTLSTNFASSAAGVINLQVGVGSSLASTAEWGSINALFDEFFVHSLTCKYAPANMFGPSGTGTCANQLNTAASGTAVLTHSVGLVWCSLFNATGYYSGAAGISNNPTRKYTHTAEPSTYRWLNNVRFDPHGPALNLAASAGWTGWSLITDSANVGGFMQCRAMNDRTVGDLAHAWTLGDIHFEWDLSFRARA